MFTLPEQFSAATKANFDAQLAMFSTLTGKVIESVEKIADLNLTLAKTAFEESNAAAKQLISAKDPQEFFNLTAAHTQPNAEKVAAYARHLASITSEAQAEFAKTMEAHASETNRKVVTFVEEVTKNAPAGTENVVAMWKSAVGTASAGYEQLNKSAKQAAETIEANLNTTVNQISKAAAKVAPRAPK